MSYEDGPGQFPDETPIEQEAAAVRYYTPEERLRGTFHEVVGTLDFAALAVPVGDMLPAPEVLARFSLRAIMPSVQRERTLDRQGWVGPWAIGEDVRITYPGGGGSVYIDGGAAIGLIYQDTPDAQPRLEAVIAGGVDASGRFVVRQIQDVTGDRKPNPLDRRGADRSNPYRRNGLHKGIRWRHTLLRAWEAVAVGMDFGTVGVRSHLHNRWHEVQQNGYGAYDQVADDLLYGRSPIDYDWYRTVS